MKVHAQGVAPHYRRHVDAVWRHLPLELRGEKLTARAVVRTLPREDIVMVGGFYDIAKFPLNRIIYVEHGAGQAYFGDSKAASHPCYHGSVHDKRVISYISPSQQVADSWDRPAFAAGCPALDVHYGRNPLAHIHAPTAAITFHWDARRVCPEAWSAREHYINDLHSMVAILRSSGFHVIGHWHPRDPKGAKIWRNLGVERVAAVDDVLSRANLLIVDNSSVAYEAAALDIKVLSLNAPWYRRDVEHGLRFWGHIPGATIDDIYEFGRFDIKDYVQYTDPSKVVRRSAAEYAYAIPPGHAGEQAATWLTKLLGEV